MSTTVTQSTSVTVDVTERVATFVTNGVLQLLLRITAGRGLGPSYIAENREVIENGLFVWLAEQKLLRAWLEVFVPGQDAALEQWSVDLHYVVGPTSGAKQPPVAALERVCSALRALPSGARYRLVVRTSPGASKVPGWQATRLRALQESRSYEFEVWGYDSVSVGLTYKEGQTDSGG